MLKDNRLRKNHEFQRIINGKKSRVSKYLVVYYQPNTLNRLQVGISVSKKFANAVGRNKLRRQVRAIFDEINIFNKSLDIVVILRKPYMNASYNQKLDSLNKILNKL